MTFYLLGLSLEILYVLIPVTFVQQSIFKMKISHEAALHLYCPID